MHDGRVASWLYCNLKMTGITFAALCASNELLGVYPEDNDEYKFLVRDKLLPKLKGSADTKQILKYSTYIF